MPSTTSRSASVTVPCRLIPRPTTRVRRSALSGRPCGRAGTPTVAGPGRGAMEGVAGAAVGFGAIDIMGVSLGVGRNGGTPISASGAAGVLPRPSPGPGSVAGEADPSLVCGRRWPCVPLHSGTPQWRARSAVQSPHVAPSSPGYHAGSRRHNGPARRACPAFRPCDPGRLVGGGWGARRADRCSRWVITAVPGPAPAGSTPAPAPSPPAPRRRRAPASAGVAAHPALGHGARMRRCATPSNSPWPSATVGDGQAPRRRSAAAEAERQRQQRQRPLFSAEGDVEPRLRRQARPARGRRQGGVIRRSTASGDRVQEQSRRAPASPARRARPRAPAPASPPAVAARPASQPCPPPARPTPRPPGRPAPGRPPARRRAALTSGPRKAGSASAGARGRGGEHHRRVATRTPAAPGCGAASGSVAAGRAACAAAAGAHLRRADVAEAIQQADRSAPVPGSSSGSRAMLALSAEEAGRPHGPGRCPDRAAMPAPGPAAGAAPAPAARRAASSTRRKVTAPSAGVRRCPACSRAVMPGRISPPARHAGRRRASPRPSRVPMMRGANGSAAPAHMRHPVVHGNDEGADERGGAMRPVGMALPARRATSDIRQAVSACGLPRPLTSSIRSNSRCSLS